MKPNKASISININLRNDLDPLILLIDPNLENLVQYACLSCITLISSSKEYGVLARVSRQILLDLYTLYNVYVPWVLVDERKVGKELCSIVRGTSCKDISVNNGDQRLMVKVDCDEIAYTCILEVD